MNVKMFKAALAGLILSFSGLVNAALISADITETLIAGDLSMSPYVLQRLGEDVSGVVDLTSTDMIANPLSWSGHVDIDITASGLITLTGREPSGFADYQNAFFDFSNILFDAGEIITGITVIDGTGLFNGKFGSTYPAPSVGFTSNSAFINYTPYPDMMNFGEGQTAQFQLQFSSVDVPEPSTSIIFSLGIMCLALRIVKKK